MALDPSVVARLARLAPDQRAAATAPPGPVLCVAPAGSGKTTTLIARIAWLVASGAARPGEIAAITFNTRAAQEMRDRLDPALEPLGVAPGAVRVRTFHALGLEILRSLDAPLPSLVDRESVLRDVLSGAPAAERRRLDTLISRLKLDLQVTAGEVASDADAGPVARSFVAYEQALEAAGAMDFDDLVIRSLRALRDSRALLDAWRARCHHLLVDEVQDVDRSQLDLALVLAAPDNFLFAVGDDDQSIYGWRLADVRRVLRLAGSLPGLRRVDLVTNYRCPRPVVERAVRLVEHNEERFAKRIAAGPRAAGRLVLAPDGSDETVRLGAVIDRWPDDGGTRAFLARTNRELVPAAMLAIERRIPFRAARVPLLLEAPEIDELLDAAATLTPPGWPLLARLGALRREVRRATAISAPEREPAELAEGLHGVAVPSPEVVRAGLDEGLPAAIADDRASPEPGAFTRDEVVAALLAWSPPYPDLAAFAAAVRERRARVTELRRDDANLTLATAHATKGLEFDHVAVIGLEAARFPSAKSLAEAVEPDRALQEERRLAYVAWTRARRSLTLVYDPDKPSQFLLEAFDPEELGCVPAR